MSALAQVIKLCDTAVMGTGLLSFVGREAELSQLCSAAKEAAQGRGATWLVTGEPGIGKSRVIEELAEFAAEQGLETHWGRCWEAGGAPSYWPWTQLLRPIVRSLEDCDPTLAQLLPELRNNEASVHSPLSPEQARFRLLDCVAATLARASMDKPRLLLLEDLHAADASSIVLLDFLSHAVRNERILIVGTFRDAEANLGHAGAPLAEVARRSKTLALRRLQRAEVADFLRSALERVDDEVIEKAYSRSEGNPLFLLEIARLWAAHDKSSIEAMPPTLQTTITERLARVATDTAKLLATAAILGREISVPRLAEVFDLSEPAIRSALHEAERVHLVVGGSHDYRFSHILVREAALASLGKREREAQHAQAARALREHAAPWSEIAHHYIEAGESLREAAVDALVSAARESMAKLAFHDACTELREAITQHKAIPGSDPLRLCELEVDLADALFRAGEEDGERTLTRAIERARTHSSASMLGYAALCMGSRWSYAHTNDDLVALLVEANDGLGSAPSPLKAQVLARLAAARQPAIDPSGPVAMARAAIDMARDSGDEQALLASLRSGCSAMVDLVPPRLRIDANREHAELARRLGSTRDEYRAEIRLAVNHFELGALRAAELSIATIERIATEMDHPSFRWQAVAFEATRALWYGRFEEAEEKIAAASALAEQAGDESAAITAIYQRFRLYRLTGRDAELIALEPSVRGLFRGSTVEPLGDICATSARIDLGLHGEDTVSQDAIDTALSLGDRSAMSHLATIVRASGNRKSARRLIEMLSDDVGDFVSTGVLGKTWDEPIHYVLALAHETLGEPDKARAYLESGMELVRRLEGWPVWVQLAAAWLELANDDEKADALRAQVVAKATEMGMMGLAKRIESRPAEPSVSLTSARPTIRFDRHGDYWEIGGGTKPLRLKHTKGLGFLAKLIANEKMELHVLDVLGAAPNQTTDLGDAGEHLDASARDAYRKRATELRELIAEAEANSDLGRMERAQQELEFLSAELSRALGLGGAERRVGQAAERARINVQRRIRDAIKRIDAHDAALARHLDRSVRTGRFCCYDPE